MFIYKAILPTHALQIRIFNICYVLYKQYVVYVFFNLLRFL